MNTLWANAPYITANTQQPRVSNDSTDITYNTYADSLDGLALAHCGIFNTSTNRWMPSLLKPVPSTIGAGVECSRFSYSTLTGTAGMTWAAYQQRLASSRGETYKTYNSITHSFDVFGTERALGVNGRSLREVGYEALSKICGLDDAANSPTAQSMKNPPASRRRRKKQGRK